MRELTCNRVNLHAKDSGYLTPTIITSATPLVDAMRDIMVDKECLYMLFFGNKHYGFVYDV
jgi:hypothetical protein